MTKSNIKTKLARRSRKAAQTFLLCLAVFTLLGAGDPATRFNEIGHQMMCVCGCKQILLECNHVGCPDSAGMRNELMTAVSRGDSDSLVEQSFVQKYGPTVLAAPTMQGFDRAAYIIPPFALILGFGLIEPAIRTWSGPMFPRSSLERLRRIARLSRDLGINLAGIAAVLDMRERIESLRKSNGSAGGYDPWTKECQ